MCPSEWKMNECDVGIACLLCMKYSTHLNSSQLLWSTLVANKSPVRQCAVFHIGSCMEWPQEKTHRLFAFNCLIELLQVVLFQPPVSHSLSFHLMKWLSYVRYKYQWLLMFVSENCDAGVISVMGLVWNIKYTFLFWIISFL